jgi:hypothetical protein
MTSMAGAVLLERLENDRAIGRSKAVNTTINLPETYACGMFDLPPVVAKLARLADGTDNTPERDSAKQQLKKRGYFLDRVGILWPAGQVPDFARDGGEE